MRPVALISTGTLLLLLSACSPAEQKRLEQRIDQLENHKLRLEKERDELYKQLTELKSKMPKEDFQYILIKKEYIKGELLDTGKIDRMTNLPEKRRIDPQYKLYFKGIHTDTEYPPIIVREQMYREATEGKIYAREDVTSLKR
jgi:hypothetical protein